MHLIKECFYRGVQNETDKESHIWPQQRDIMISLYSAQRGGCIRSSNKQSTDNLYPFHRQVWSKDLAAGGKRRANQDSPVHKEKPAEK